MRNWLQGVWYEDAFGAWLLWPLSLVFRFCAALRRSYLRLRSVKLDVPVVVVGNLSVGGTGKTPLIIALVVALREAGYRPGVISRGYGAKPPGFPFRVNADGNIEETGDEPLLIARQAACPVVIDPDRARAGRYLLETTDCNVILSDDGLQHYRLQRDIEIAVIDGSRGLGNGYCLPAGPLRESVQRLNSVDFVVVNGQLQQPLPVAVSFYAMRMGPAPLRALIGSESCPIEQWSQGIRVHGVAGIGNPQRFWQSLEELGFDVIRHPFPDHHVYRPADLAFGDTLPVVMTAKDAVKCAAIADSRCWQLPVSAILDNRLIGELRQKIEKHRQ